MQNTIKAMTAAALIGLSGCVSSIPQGAPVTLTDDMRAAVEAGVKRRLKDPNSAMFDRIQASRINENAYNVCGFVNAKNSFGGYNGNAPFYGVLYKGTENMTFDFRTMADTSKDGEMWALQAVCKQAGVPLFMY